MQLRSPPSWPKPKLTCSSCVYPRSCEWVAPGSRGCATRKDSRTDKHSLDLLACMICRTDGCNDFRDAATAKAGHRWYAVSNKGVDVGDEDSCDRLDMEELLGEESSKKITLKQTACIHRRCKANFHHAHA